MLIVSFALLLGTGSPVVVAQGTDLGRSKRWTMMTTTAPTWAGWA